MKNHLPCRVSLAARLVCAMLTVSAVSQSASAADIDAPPQSYDPRVEISLFASEPDLVHPVGAAFDTRGRLLVIESHTHFAPDDYQGHPHDRIRRIEDTDGDGRADRFTTFFEGTRATMDIARHPDGSIYLATRSEILRLRDTNGDGRADQKQQIVTLDTPGNYPHNGLSGLAFDGRDDLYFGMGENLGAPYTLRGSDGAQVADQGEGGNIFWCTADGKSLRRVATGFWNPFGVAIDIYGRIFAVDNDPDASPPCRLLHIVEGGDYGYRFRYGRSGRHPFQAWNGQLPGTLPMAAGVGEAPCEIVSYEAEGLPEEYRGDLLVASWAEHRLERYRLEPNGASYRAARLKFIEGGNDFRPVGIAVAPDGSLWVTDWVRRDYKLHGHGRIWHVRLKQSLPQTAVAQKAGERKLRQALTSKNRARREAAAVELLEQGEPGWQAIRNTETADPRIRATLLGTRIHHGDPRLTDQELQAIAREDAAVPLQAMATAALARRNAVPPPLHGSQQPGAVRLAAIGALDPDRDRAALLHLLASADPFIRSRAATQLGKTRPIASLMELLLLPAAAEATPPAEVRRRLVAALSGNVAAQQSSLPGRLLQDRDPLVQFLAAKWIADANLRQHRGAVEQAMQREDLDPTLYFALAATLARLDDRKADDRELGGYFARMLASADASPRLQVMALRLVPPDHKLLEFAALDRLVASRHNEVRQEAVRTLSVHPDNQRWKVLAQVARDSTADADLRAWAVVGLSHDPARQIEPLMDLARDKQAAVQREVLRGLSGSMLPDGQRAALQEVAEVTPELEPLVARIIKGEVPAERRPELSDLPAWQQLLSDHEEKHGAEIARGMRIFHAPQPVACSRCHRVHGRGSDVGPDLSLVGRAGRKRILASILQPSKEIAPHYQLWALATDDGRVRSGMLLRTHLDEQTYLDAKGNQFQVNTKHVIARKAVPKSIMPDGLAGALTVEELADLLAFLGSLK